MPNQTTIETSERILVTGSNGFIGTRVVDQLLERGFRRLRCFVRPSSRLTALQAVLGRHQADSDVEIVTGDLLSKDDCRTAARDVAVICHLAAGFEKSFAGAYMNSALATRNLLEAFLDVGNPRRFVNVSSFAVYSNMHLARGAVLDESCPLEDHPQARNDAYGFAKRQQEELVKEYGQSRGVPYVILRPGAVFGPGKPAPTGRVCIDTFGFLLHMGGSNVIPFTYVDNCAEAVVLAALVPGAEGAILNVVDDTPWTSRRFFRAYKGAAGRRFSLPVPYLAASAGSRLWEWYSKKSGGQLPPVFNRRRCAAEWKGNRYSNEKLKSTLGWLPRVPMDQGMKSYLDQLGRNEG